MTNSKGTAIWGVVFDLDGLLVDSEPLQAESFNEVFAPYGIYLSEDDFEELVGYQTVDNFRHLRKKFAIETPLDELMALKRVAYHQLVRTRMVPCIGAMELVEGLATLGARLAVASSSPREDVLLSLDTIGLSKYFPAVFAADDVAATKPAPDLYLKASAAIEVPPARCLAFEDSGAGLTAAVAAGLRCFTVPHRYTRDHDFSAAEAVLETLADITPEEVRTLALS
jgi:HAD superfamily hydrolase (TIGR01509 family)